MEYAVLSSKSNYTIFKFGNHVICQPAYGDYA